MQDLRNIILPFKASTIGPGYNAVDVIGGCALTLRICHQPEPPAAPALPFTGVA